MNKKSQPLLCHEMERETNSYTGVTYQWCKHCKNPISLWDTCVLCPARTDSNAPPTEAKP